MDAIRTMLRRLCRSQRGATAIEYGLIAALIAIASVGAVSLLGGGSNGLWTDISDRVAEAVRRN